MANTQLPAEVLEEINQKAHQHSEKGILSDKFSYVIGATEYATKMHQEQQAHEETRQSFKRQLNDRLKELYAKCERCENALKDIAGGKALSQLVAQQALKDKGEKMAVALRRIVLSVIAHPSYTNVGEWGDFVNAAEETLAEWKGEKEPVGVEVQLPGIWLIVSPTAEELKEGVHFAMYKFINDSMPSKGILEVYTDRITFYGIGMRMFNFPRPCIDVTGLLVMVENSQIQVNKLVSDWRTFTTEQPGGLPPITEPILTDEDVKDWEKLTAEEAAQRKEAIEWYRNPAADKETTVFVPCLEHDPRCSGGYTSNCGRSLCFVRETTVPVIEQGAVWVKASERLPQAYEKLFIKVEGEKSLGSWHTHHDLFIDDSGDFHPADQVEWLDESAGEEVKPSPT